MSQESASNADLWEKFGGWGNGERDFSKETLQGSLKVLGMESQDLSPGFVPKWQSHSLGKPQFPSLKSGPVVPVPSQADSEKGLMLDVWLGQVTMSYCPEVRPELSLWVRPVLGLDTCLPLGPQ